MIKVNLLKDQTARTGSPVSRPTASPLTRITLAILLPIFLGVGGAWYYLHAQITDLTESRDRLRIEFARLQDLRKQIDKYAAMKAERQSRINIIEDLLANQKGPVLLLNHVVHSIPTSAALWLTGLEQKGNQVRIMGYTEEGETVPDFMTNLAATGFFKSVDLELYEDQENKAANFTLVCISIQRIPTE